MQNREPHTDVEDQPPASPADALAIIQREQARQEPHYSRYFLLWGVVWLLIGLAWFGAQFGYWTAASAVVATLVLVVVATALTAVIGVRTGRGIEGPSARSGIMFGLGWLVAMLGTGAIATAFSSGIQVSAFPVLFVFVAGVLYMAIGALEHSRLDYAAGLAVQLIAVVTAFTPAPWNTLVMGIGGGGALVITGLLHRRHR